MVRISKHICSMGIPRAVTITEYICDSCGCQCDPKSYDVTEHYFVSERGGFCWECMMEEYGIDDVG